MSNVNHNESDFCMYIFVQALYILYVYLNHLNCFDCCFGDIEGKMHAITFPNVA